MSGSHDTWPIHPEIESPGPSNITWLWRQKSFLSLFSVVWCLVIVVVGTAFWGSYHNRAQKDTTVLLGTNLTTLYHQYASVNWSYTNLAQCLSSKSPFWPRPSRHRIRGIRSPFINSHYSSGGFTSNTVRPNELPGSSPNRALKCYTHSLLPFFAYLSNKSYLSFKQYIALRIQETLYCLSLPLD